MPVQRGVLIEFVFGSASFQNGYTQIGSFKSDASDWPQIYITAPIDWVDAKLTDPDFVKSFLQEMATGFVKAFDEGEVDTSTDRYRYYLVDEEEDTAITLGYFSSDNENPSFIGGNPLSSDEFLTFQNARDRIAEFYKDTVWFSPIVENYNVLRTVIDAIQEKFAKSGRPDYSGEDIVNINSAFNTYLTSITSYLNHIEKELKNRNDGLYWDQFYKHKSEEYDKNVSYRLLYGLRNYIQHQAPPIHIRYKSELIEEKPVYKVEMFCSKGELLKSDKWQKTTQVDIQHMDDIIDIVPHIDSEMDSLDQILIKHLQDEFSYLREDATFIHNLLRKIPEGKDIGVYELHFSNKKLVGMTPHLMYTKIVEAIVENNVYKILKRN
jgi:hypothetical protein